MVYTFYTRGRNTPAAWPSIRLPEPLSREFADACEACAALERVDDGFRLHGVTLPDHRSAEFWPRAFEVLEAWRQRQHAEAKDVAALIDGFREHEAYTSLAPSTRRGYDGSADILRAAWAYELPTLITAVDCQQLIDEFGNTPAKANQLRAFMSRLFSWGIPRGFLEINPAEPTEKIPGGEPWKPWPEWAFETLIEHAPFNCLMPAISSIFTGQRQVDVLKMPRPRPVDVEIEVTAQKTSSTVWIPIHTTYRAWIERATALYVAGNEARAADRRPAVVSGALHLGVRGLPYQTTDGFRSEWQRLMATKPFRRFREERIVFHGLRKNAVNNLLEVGCTETQVGAIVNMSEQMVRHYGRDVNLKRLARDGMQMLEARWAEVGPKFLEREQNANWKPARRIGNRWERSRPE